MKKHIFRILGVSFMVLSLVLSQIPAAALQAEEEITVTTDESGFMMNGTTLVKYTGTASAVSVPSGVTEIGEEAFADNTTMTSLYLPSSLRTIKNSAFSGCTSLTSVNMAEGVKSIETGAFAECKSLSEVNLPASVIELGTSVFAGCSSLKTIAVDSDNQYFTCVDGVLYNLKMTKLYQFLAGVEGNTFDMPDTVEEIKKYAFWGCDNLEIVYVSSNLTAIDDYAFSNASGLTTITLPYSVRSIGIKAFEDCTALRYIYIPVSVTTIDDTAFDGCYRLSFDTEAGSVGEEYAANFEANLTAQLEYEDSVSGNSVSQVNPHTTDEEVEEETVASKNYYASDVDNYVEWDVDSPGVLGRTKVAGGKAVIFYDTYSVEVSGGSDSSDSDSDDSVSGNGTANADGADSTTGKTVTITPTDEDGTVAYKAYYMDTDLTQVSIGQGITEIGDLAFARSGLTSVTIPAGVTHIGQGAFYHCDDLTSVTIPSTVTTIDANAFDYTPWMENWKNNTLVSDFLVVGDGILLAYKGTDANVTIPDNVKTIAASVFSNHTEITKVTIPDSVTYIGEEAFYQCKNLVTVSGGSEITEICDRAFYGCPIKSIRIGEHVETIGNLAYGGASGIQSVTFLGTTLPTLTYGDNAQRLSVERGLAFADIDVVIVPSGLTTGDLSGTVLDGTLAGYEGGIYQVDTSSRYATLLQVNGSEEDFSAPDTIKQYDTSYKVEESTSVLYVTAEKSDLSLGEQLVVDHSSLDISQVSVSDITSSIDLTGYHFYVSDPTSEDEKLRSALEAVYGTVLDSDYLAFDLTLYDEYDVIPITKLGNNAVRVMIQVPSQFLDDELCVVSLDNSGNLEITYVTYDTIDEVTYISFDVNHCSPYALYAASGELASTIAMKVANASGSSTLDDTPDTGDKSNYTLVWFALFAGLFCLGAGMVLVSFNRRLML